MKSKTQHDGHHSGNTRACEIRVYEAYTIYVDTAVRVGLPPNVGHALHVTATVHVFKIEPCAQ